MHDDHPRSIIIEPIFNDLNDGNEEVAGILFGALSWDKYFIDVLPEGSPPVIVEVGKSRNRLYLHYKPIKNLLKLTDSFLLPYDDDVNVRMAKVNLVVQALHIWLKEINLNTSVQEESIMTLNLIILFR